MYNYYNKGGKWYDKNEYFKKQPLNESASLQTIGLSNGVISLVDNKGNVFKAKLEKIGNTNEKK